MEHNDLKDAFLELIRLCAVELPRDVRTALEKAREKEEPGSMAYNTFDSILKNVEAAKERNVPMCQDTGAPIFWISYGGPWSQMAVEMAAEEALAEASRIPYLRPNAVDPITGKNSGNNLGSGVPLFHFHQWEHDRLEVALMLKGGGSENASSQYKLPNSELGAGRDLDGVRRCVLDAVNNVQGLGCAPGIIGVGIGGSRDTGYEAGKKALLRRFEDDNPDKDLDRLEKLLLRELNHLGIGPMGFGGRTTVLAVKAAALHRVPASYFVSISYTCWALRRHVMTIEKGVASYD